MSNLHNALQKFSGLPEGYRAITGGDEIELLRAGETLTPVLDMWSRPEFALPRDELLFGAVVQPPASVGNLGNGALVNPAGSGNLVVVQGLIRSGVAVAWTWGIALEAAVIAADVIQTGVAPCDTRRFGTAITNLLAVQVNIGNGQSAGSIRITVSDQVNTPAAADQDRLFRVPLILKPGFAAVIECTTANTAGTGLIFGYARKATLLELAP